MARTNGGALRCLQRAAALVTIGIALAGCAVGNSASPLASDAIPLPRPSSKALLDRQKQVSRNIPLPRPSPKSIALEDPSWRHVRQPVSAEEFRKDKATCELASNIAPGADSRDGKYVVFTDCMRSKGYQPAKIANGLKTSGPLPQFSSLTYSVTLPPQIDRIEISDLRNCLLAEATRKPQCTASRFLTSRSMPR